MVGRVAVGGDISHNDSREKRKEEAYENDGELNNGSLGETLTEENETGS